MKIFKLNTISSSDKIKILLLTAHRPTNYSKMHANKLTDLESKIIRGTNKSNPSGHKSKLKKGTVMILDKKERNLEQKVPIRDKKKEKLSKKPLPRNLTLSNKKIEMHLKEPERKSVSSEEPSQ